MAWPRRCDRASREILEAANGDEALTLIRQQQPDLVFLDLNMPGRDGMSVLSEFASRTKSSLPEILIVTANDTVHHAVQSIRLGASDFLTKPYEVDHIRAIARRSEQRLQCNSKCSSCNNSSMMAKAHRRSLVQSCDGTVAQPDSAGSSRVVTGIDSRRERYGKEL